MLEYRGEDVLARLPHGKLNLNIILRYTERKSLRKGVSIIAGR
jgi:hypothetical protein